MARKKTLVNLLDGLRAACRMSLNAAHNSQHRDAQIKMLQEKQEFFWGDFAWPHLRVDRFINVQAGQRYYDMPADLDIDRISHIEVRFGQAYNRLRWGIDAPQYAAFDSELDQRSDPIQRCKITEDEQLEVWPIAQTDFDATTLEGRMKITGIRTLLPLVADSDRADLDDQLLILSCAGDYLAASGAKDAQLKIDQANRLYLKLKGRLMPRKRFSIGQGRMNNDDTRPVRIPIAVYNKTS